MSYLLYASISCAKSGDNGFLLGSELLLQCLWPGTLFPLSGESARGRQCSRLGFCLFGFGLVLFWFLAAHALSPSFLSVLKHLSTA